LAKEIGESEALAFYQLSLKSTEKFVTEAAQSNSSISPFWAVAEEKALNHPLWASWPRVLQKGEGLGLRMASVYRALRQGHDFVMLLGADCPHMPSDFILQAYEKLSSGNFDFVLGPSTDGGFYLFAASLEFSDKQWTIPQYSTPQTRVEFVQALKLQKERCFLLPELFDIDTKADLERLNGAWCRFR
jgi:glycosyltransferase A (GT-A) superfamily protein (DUF2064 family)